MLAGSGLGLCGRRMPWEAIAAARSAGMRIAFSRHLSSPAAWMGATPISHRDGVAEDGRPRAP